MKATYKILVDCFGEEIIQHFLLNFSFLNDFENDYEYEIFYVALYPDYLSINANDLNEPIIVCGKNYYEELENYLTAVDRDSKLKNILKNK